jgi:hypothetical protein
MQIVAQTKVALVGYVLLLVSQLILLFKKNTKAVSFVPSIVLFVLMGVLGLYVINCVVLGSCLTYAWIMSGILVGAGVLFAIFSLFIFKKLKP